MTYKDFDELTVELLSDVVKMRDTKGKEYADKVDRLSNFKDIANELALTPLQVWSVYFMKHIRSIQSFIRRGETLSDESIKSRFVDAITYLLLGYGLIVEATLEKDKIINRKYKYDMSCGCEITTDSSPYCASHDCTITRGYLPL